MDTLNSEFEIIPYSKKYYDDWIVLFEKTVKKRKHVNHYLYNTTKNPFGEPIQFLMKHKDKIVGSHSIRPLQFRINDKIVLGGLTYDSLTDPEYQNMGIFTKLVNTTQTEAKKQNYQFVYGYANANSIGTYQKDLYHTKLAEINFIKITDFKREEIPEPIYFCLSEKYALNFSEFLSNTRDKQFACTVDKCIKYLLWRYNQKHHHHYNVIFAPKRFLIILKVYEKQQQIVEFMATDAVAFREALSVTAHVAKSHHNVEDLTMWIPANHRFLKEAEIKYETLTAKQFLHVISFNDNLTQSILNSYNWNYTMGDCDVF